MRAVGTRLLGRLMPIGWGWRLAIILVAALTFLVYTFYLTGSSLAAQAQAMRVIVETQLNRLGQWLPQLDITTMPGYLGPADFTSLGRKAMDSTGRQEARRLGKA